MKRALRYGSLYIRHQQHIQNLLIAQLRLPHIRRKDGFIEALVGEN